MGANFLSQLSEYSLSDVCMILLLVAALTIGVIEGGQKLLGLLGLELKKDRLKRESEKRIKKLEDRITTLEGSADKFNKDRVNDRAQSFEIQKHWTDLINAMTEKQDEIITRVDALAEQNRKYQLADIRETLLQAYRYYTNPSTNILLAWTEMEKHAFDEQYDVYVSNKGNSYIENTVKPEMDKLRVIHLNDYEDMAELMSSRSKNNN